MTCADACMSFIFNPRQGKRPFATGSQAKISPLGKDFEIIHRRLQAARARLGQAPRRWNSGPCRPYVILPIRTAPAPPVTYWPCPTGNGTHKTGRGPPDHRQSPAVLGCRAQETCTPSNHGFQRLSLYDQWLVISNSIADDKAGCETRAAAAHRGR